MILFFYIFALREDMKKKITAPNFVSWKETTLVYLLKKGSFNPAWMLFASGLEKNTALFLFKNEKQHGTLILWWKKNIFLFQIDFSWCNNWRRKNYFKSLYG